MNVIKRDGREVQFQREKIINAISKASSEVSKSGVAEIPQSIINGIAEELEKKYTAENYAVSVEYIQDDIEMELMKKGYYEVARAYIRYRYERQLYRNGNSTDGKILSLVDGTNEDVIQENSNKNPRIAATQRDYIAGEVSRDITKRILLPKDIKEADENGIIHFHDSDYFIEHIPNCCLVNLDDMLKNGTVINGSLIETPKSFSTACNIATQIMAQIASNQYGGQSESLAHLVDFIDVSRQKIKLKELDTYIQYAGHEPMTDQEYEKYLGVVDKRVREEVRDGVQTIQYQINTLMTTNGQTPFVTLFMYLGEVPEGKKRDDFAILIEEVLKQRIQGIKNEKGVWITPAFPKLIYVLEKDNITEDSPYWYLTKLAAKCTAKRMVPDYISEKKMLEIKGDVYTCMGCVDGKAVVTYAYDGSIYTESFEQMWDRLSYYFRIDKQPNLIDFVMQTPGVTIFDQKVGFVDNYGIIKNHSSEWLRITFSNGAVIMCTPDHPFENENGKIVFARDLTESDLIAAKAALDDPNKTCHIVKVEPVHKDGFSYDVTTSSEHFTVSGIYSHNCRSFLTPDDFTDAGVGNVANALNYNHTKHKYYGRFNQGVVTINLVDVGLSAHKNYDLFWSIFDERLELCHRALQIRHNRLLGTLSDTSPVHWQHGALARLEKGETIDKLLYDGYSTISLGYAGLYECVKAMTGKSHTDPSAKEFALSIMQFMNDKCAEWREKENIAYSLYGSPIESTTYKFAKCLKKRFGVIEGITDKNYITNSYHVPVTEKIDAFSKLSFESEFQQLSPGGAISYVEVPNLTNNIEAVLSVMKFIYENIMYAELNTKSDYCQVCGYDGEIQIVEDGNGKLIWKCPNCGNVDKSKMNIARRTCGYIGSDDWNQGRTQEIKERVVHLGDN